MCPHSGEETKGSDEETINADSSISKADGSVLVRENGPRCE